ncbi:P-loop containing nucleoside triphosphate hydrolase protein [Aspergillus steynii IBT 23096]|uniref:P-loop containing nucleoside triphosphate hydrolase protein n=1 Tax=Aspergillus steynii IBT 23096 TaxID=1392250 RepID=A0A2I2GGK8_9EURO|nr:P-loop containing nucleoside triphosphate hydrolase protein [Aspergillus steynii IBT 23096]PLB52013.1 P-loop containing nucleoside triphosphate hydrolase protein [Aspergillus steynii IBT 23096]
MFTEYPWLNISSSLLSSIFILYAPLEIWRLRGASIKVLPDFQSHIKTVLAVALSGVQLISLASPTVPNSLRDQIPAIASILASSELFVLLRLGHRKTVRPSTSVILYVGLSLIKDLIALTLPSHNLTPIEHSLLLIQVVLEAGLLVAESRSKVQNLHPRYQSLTAEERTGVLGRVFFWWINPVLREGYRDVLVPESLPGVDRALSSKVLRERVIHAWAERSKPETKFTLPLALFKAFRRGFLLPILPRFSLVAFRYSQPVLIGATIDFIQQRGSQDERVDSGYWLVVLTGAIYSGLAISTSVYRHRLNRLQLIIRGALVGLIHARALNAESSPVTNGKALTLMSADVDSVDTAAEMVHETWAQMGEVLVGTALLARQIGWFVGLPLLIIFGCSRMSAYVAKHLQGRQKDWSSATQRRLSMITAVLGGVKSMKILGLEEATRSIVSDLRDREIAMSKRLRWIMVAYNASVLDLIIANALGIFSPVVTLVLFAVSRRGDAVLNPDTVFTSIALLALVTHPANMVMTLITRAVAALANFDRIQTYLLKGSLLDQRVLVPPNSVAEREYNLETGQRLAILMEDVKIQPSPTSQPIMHGLNLGIDRGSIFMCSGAVGSGKSVLASTILGEMAPKEGRIVVADERIGFCSQSVWLPTASIRGAICQGTAKVDNDWYDTVIEACGLSPDLQSLVDKDRTWVGSGGINLSGGQKSRIALARAVYSRCSILVLDDPFSALDGEVEDHVVAALLGPRGLLRDMCTTVFLITNSAQYYPLADKVVLLHDGQAQVLDPRDEIILSRAQISKVNPSQGIKREESKSNSPALADRKRMDYAAADVSRRTGDLALYGYYFGSVGTFSMLLMASYTAIYAFCLTFSSTHIIIAPRSGSTLHARLLGKIMKVPLSYFSTFEIGNVDGIATIRASGWETSFELDNIMALRNTATGAEVGVALNMIIAANTTLLRLVEGWTSLETSLGAVARLRSVDLNTPPEGEDIGNHNLSSSVTSPSTSNPANDGKSTLFLALLRLITPQTGSIKLADIDIATLHPHTVRRRGFIAVPRTREEEDGISVSAFADRGPLYLSCPELLEKPISTFAPLSAGQMQMFALAQALLRVQAVSFQSPSPSAALDPGHDSISANYNSADTGLKPNSKPIVILDEASSALDLETERRMQKLVDELIIQKGFTVILISHREGGLRRGVGLESDVVVLRDGRVC